jgi:hypothetical protein
MASLKPLTLAHLRSLVSLHHAGVEGASAELVRLANGHTEHTEHTAHTEHTRHTEHTKELRALLQLDDGPLDAETLIRAIEARPRLLREEHARTQHETAASLALRVAETAEPRAHQCFALDVALLGRALAAYPGRVITLGVRGSLSSLKLRALVREVRAFRTSCVLVTERHVVITYEGAQCRGLVKLVLHPVVHNAGALIVPLGFTRSTSINAEPPSEAHDIDVPLVRLPPARPFLVALLDAVREHFFGGAP